MSTPDSDQFLDAQVADPFDPAPMRIQADWLEEHGDQVGAEVLRGLAENGTPSLVALALEATLRPVPSLPDLHGEGSGRGSGEGDSFGYDERGLGCGDGDDANTEGLQHGYGGGAERDWEVK